ncbi:uncharacterized protein LOC141857071 [Brevipalpus obovatus]|uniref:uncharacterized protein LOC141857071 n=1 Tax=Brevipalpus obovatus TaxID=246614 RepID=UPI003D9F3D3F
MYLPVILLVHLSCSLVSQAKHHHVPSSPAGIIVNSSHRSTSSVNFVPPPAKPLYSPIKRSSSSPSMFIAAPGNMASASTNQPSLVAIPLYFRNDRISAQRTPLLYEMFMSALSDSNRLKAPLAAVSSTNFPIKFDPIASSPLKPEAKYVPKITNPQTLYSQQPSSPATSYMRPSSTNEPSYEESGSQGIAAAAYAAASPHSHLNMAAGYGKGKTVSGEGAKVLRNPGLRPVAFDDHQKAAFHDFTGALEQYDLKALTNSDLHSMPHIAPGDLTGHSVTSKKSSGGGQGYDSGSNDYGQSGGSSYGGSGGGGQSYGGSSGDQSYGGGQSGGQSYGGSSGGQSYGGSSGGQSYGGSSGGQSYGGGSSDGYGSSSGNSEYDPTGYGYSVPSPKSSGGYGQSGGSGYGGSSGSSQGYSQQSSGGGSYGGGQSGGGSYGGGQSGGGSYGGSQSSGGYESSGPDAGPAYMSAYPVENNFGAEVHAAYRESGSPVPYTSAGNPFGDVSGQSAGGSGGGSDYSSSSSSSYNYDASPSTYSNVPQSSSYGSTDDAYSSSSASSQTYAPSNYASSGQSPVSASRVYSSTNYALASPVSSSGNQMYSLSSVENQVTGERSLRNQQQQSASPSYTSNSYSNPSFYSIASVPGSGSYGSSASYTSKLIPKASNNYEKSVINDYYADPDCQRDNNNNEYNSGSSSVPSSSIVSSSSPSASQGSSSYASAGKSSQISENSYSLGSSSQNGAKGLISSAIQAYEPEELDPSKLDLKIVHLPVSVLKKLVSSGDVALGNQQLYSSN